MRHLLVARFESSVAAFQASLGYMIQSSEHLLRWIEKRHKIPVFKKGNLPDVEAFMSRVGMERKRLKNFSRNMKIEDSLR